MSSRPPNRYSPQKLHNIYGVEHWLKTKHKCTGSNTDTIIFDYCEYKKQPIKSRDSAIEFIQKNFISFATYASNKLKSKNDQSRSTASCP